MSTLIWPTLPSIDAINDRRDQTLAAELDWFLASLQDTLSSLKEGLEECAQLLTPREPGSTLVLSSLRSESLKGFVTRIGTRIVKGDIQLRLPSLPIPRGQNAHRLTLSPSQDAPPVILEQLTTTRTLINACLDVVDATRWTGDSRNANFISGQLRLLNDNISEAKMALKGTSDGLRPWCDDPIDANAFNPPLPPNISFHLSISEAAVVLNVRTLEPALLHHHTGTNTPLTPTGTPQSSAAPSSFTGLSLRERLASALGGVASTSGRSAFHDEVHDVFSYKGHDVRVREKVRVESQDPSLMSALAKLGALERNVALSRRALAMVMGVEHEDP